MLDKCTASFPLIYRLDELVLDINVNVRLLSVVYRFYTIGSIRHGIKVMLDGFRPSRSLTNS